MFADIFALVEASKSHKQKPVNTLSVFQRDGLINDLYTWKYRKWLVKTAL